MGIAVRVVIKIEIKSMGTLISEGVLREGWKTNQPNGFECLVIQNIGVRALKDLNVDYATGAFQFKT